MYTVKAIPNDGDVVNIVETHATYNDAKERAISLVHFMHKDAKVFTQSGTLLFHITFNGEFEEKEYPMPNLGDDIIKLQDKISTLEKANDTLINQRNLLLSMLTKEQLIDMVIASGSLTE